MINFDVSPLSVVIQFFIPALQYFVSDIAVFVLRRDFELQPSDQPLQYYSKID